MLVRVRPIAAILAASICLAGCERLGVLPERKDNGRYQLMKDARGQTLRLDTVTGQIVVIDSSTIPSEGSSGRRAAPAEATLAGATPPAPAVEPQVQPTPDTPVEESPAVTARAAQAPLAAANACEQIGDPGREFVVSAPADAFVEPSRPGVPVANLPSGTPVQGIKIQGNWLLVRFHDQVWGERSAYIACSSVLAGKDGGRGRPTN